MAQIHALVSKYANKRERFRVSGARKMVDHLGNSS